MQPNVRINTKAYKQLKIFVRRHKLEFPSIANFVNISVVEKLESYKSPVKKIEKFLKEKI